MQLTGYALTHQGRIRKNNEDNFYLFGDYKKDISVLEVGVEKEASVDMSLAAVFDGMGGEEAGEVASLIAAESVSPSDINSVKSNTEYQLKTANGKICDEIIKRNARVGTTAVLLYFDGSEAISVNIGDSRAYLFRDRQLKPLSKDHSEGQTMVDMGVFTEEQAKKNKAWHKLTQHLGIFPEEFEIEPYLSERISIRKDDIYLLCSDGLTDMLSNEQIGSIIDQNKEMPLKDISEQLRDAALSSGGRDNITVVLVRVEEEEVKESNKFKNMFMPMMVGILIGAVLMLVVSTAIRKIKDDEDESLGKEIDKSIIMETPENEEKNVDETDNGNDTGITVSNNKIDKEEEKLENVNITEEEVSDNIVSENAISHNEINDVGVTKESITTVSTDELYVNSKEDDNDTSLSTNNVDKN